jgi:hypothetical protein
MPESIDPATPDALLAMRLLDTLTAAGRPWACLRGHEKLPVAVGNDIDLLVGCGSRASVADLFRTVAEEEGWRELYRAHFGPLAQYFVHPESSHTLHLDIFDRIEWRFLSYAEASGILKRRIWNGIVYTPCPEDTIYLNLMGRLLYQGVIRENHRREALGFPGGDAALCGVFDRHLGNPGSQLAAELAKTGWQPERATARLARKVCATRFCWGDPISTTKGLVRWAGRIIRKIASPPGKLIVFEGADGVGKSTVLDVIVPWCATWCGGRTPYRFHWKPRHLSPDAPPSQGPVDPRANPARGFAPSLLFLAAHLAGYWWGWVVRIRPRLSASHAVVGDRYSYDLFLYPARFRLALPSSL